MINKNSMYYVAAAVFFILLKFTFAAANSDSLAFLIGPTNQIVQLVTGSHSTYLPGNGYYHSELNVLIDKSCSGYNFLLITFIMLVFRTVNVLKKTALKILLFPLAITAAYVLTIFVNSSRIIVSIYIQKHSGSFLPDSMDSVVHESIGVITNLSFLIAIYYLTEKILTNKLNHAQPA